MPELRMMLSQFDWEIIDNNVRGAAEKKVTPDVAVANIIGSVEEWIHQAYIDGIQTSEGSQLQPFDAEGDIEI